MQLVASRTRQTWEELQEIPSLRASQPRDRRLKSTPDKRFVVGAFKRSVDTLVEPAVSRSRDVMVGSAFEAFGNGL